MADSQEKIKGGDGGNHPVISTDSNPGLNISKNQLPFMDPLAEGLISKNWSFKHANDPHPGQHSTYCLGTFSQSGELARVNVESITEKGGVQLNVISSPLVSNDSDHDMDMSAGERSPTCFLNLLAWWMRWNMIMWASVLILRRQWLKRELVGKGELKKFLLTI